MVDHSYTFCITNAKHKFCIESLNTLSQFEIKPLNCNQLSHCMMYLKIEMFSFQEAADFTAWLMLRN